MVSRVFRHGGAERAGGGLLPSLSGGERSCFYYTEVFARVPTPKGQKGWEKENFFDSDPLFFAEW